MDRHRVEDRGRLIRLAALEAEAIRGEFAELDVSWRDLIPADSQSEQRIHVAEIQKEIEENLKGGGNGE